MRSFFSLAGLLAGAVLVVAITSRGACGYTKELVEKRGVLNCGVSVDSPGFSTVNEAGKWSGMDVDFCRAVAAAIFGDAAKVEFIPLEEKKIFTPLLAGEVDLVARHVTWTFIRDTALAVNFAGILYYDEIGFLVPAEMDVKNVDAIKEAVVCNVSDSQYETIVRDFFRQRQIRPKFVSYQSESDAVKGIMNGSCNLLALPVAQLTALARELSGEKSFDVVAGGIGKTPFSPVIRQGDDNWSNLVRWVYFALITAEELGVNSRNVVEMRLSNLLAVKRLLGVEGNMGAGLGLENSWAANVVGQVGNYRELFDKNLGKDSALKLKRGKNKLWNDGGLHYAPPMR